MPTTSAISSAGAATPTVSRGAQVNKDDFLKLLVAQLSHQDPLKPQDDTAFVAQLAQFAQLEQAQNQTEVLTQLQALLAGQNGAQAVGLVGREVTARFSSLSIANGAAPAPLQFTLDGDAASVTLILRDSQGKTVRTIRQGALKAGPQALTWDGKGDDGAALPAGTYQVEASAAAQNGAAVPIKTEVKGPCLAVSFENGRPELLLAGGIRVQLADVITVSK